MRSLNRIICWLLGHKWTSVHGYHNLPNFGASCLRCGKEAETLEEYNKRYGRV